MSSIKDKLFNYEVTPPANSWDKIAANLDKETFSDKYPGLLHDMEVNPAPHNWNKINQALNADTVEEVKQNNKPIRSIPIWRYAAAAAVIAAVSIAIMNWGGNRDKTGSLATADGPTQEPTVAKTKESAPTIEQIPGIPETDPAQPNNVVPQKLIAQANKTTKTSRNPTGNISYNANTALYTYDDLVPSIADRYVMLMTPDGNFIRMSKKWSNMICCVSGEEQDADCKDQLKKWQEKLAQSSMTSGNFMDILDLVNSLDETSDL